MIPDVNIGEYLRIGGVYNDIEGASPTEAFEDLCNKVNLPHSLKPKILYEALCARESVLSTATHFVLKKYKDYGVIFEKEKKDERMIVSP